MADPMLEIKGINGATDQYADGEAAKIWEIFTERTKNYKHSLVEILTKNGCKRILDVACGIGIDSIMLLEEGFEVVSTDASDKMLKYALKERWNRRKEKAFDNWIIEEANWLTLYEDIRPHINEGFDAVICIGNSFSHMLDNDGNQTDQKKALRNFEKCLKPGGLLVIDHRNYENILNTGHAPSKSIYYDSEYMADIKTSVVSADGKNSVIVMDYVVNILEHNKNITSEFRLFYYPHRLEDFKQMLREIFGEESHLNVYGDFKPLNEIQHPIFYLHLVQKFK